MSKKMGSLQFSIFIVLFSVIHQILSDHPLACVPSEFRMKRSHAFNNNIEKREELTRANMPAAAKYQTPKTRPMNLCIGEPITRRHVPVPLVRNKATATVIQPKNVATATIIQPKGVVTGTIVHPKVINNPTITVQPKPVATATDTQTVIQPQINPTVSIVQPKCVSTASVSEPNVMSAESPSEIQPKTTGSATVIQTKPGTLRVNPTNTELTNSTTFHNENSPLSETHHVFHDIHGNSNDTERHYIVNIPIDHNSNNTNTIHHVIVNHTHSVDGKKSNVHDDGAFYEENFNGAKIFHTVSQDTSTTATLPLSSSTDIELTEQNRTDNHEGSSCNDKSEIFEMMTPKPNVKQESAKTLSDVLKQVNIQLSSTPKPLISGKFDGIKVIENKMEEHNLDQIKLEPDDDIVIDKFDVEEVKESYKNPADYTNDLPTVSSGWCIYPTVDNQGIQSSNGAIISYNDYLNYYNTGGYKDNSFGAYNYGSCKGNSKAVYNRATKAPKAKKLSKAERNVLKDRIWRKWINTQIFIRRPTHKNALPDLNQHVNSTSWSQEQKIPVIGYNGYYTNENNSCCS